MPYHLKTSKAGSRIQRFSLPVRPLFIFFLLLLSCNRAWIRYAGHPIASKLRIDFRDGGRATLFRMPASKFPDKSDEDSLIPLPENDPVYTGLDALSMDGFSLLRGRSFALLTNSTGRDHNLDQGINLMLRAGIRPSLVFEPEHGMYSFEESRLADGVRIDRETGLRIVSLYSSHVKPTAAQLKGIDLIVVDIQNLPVRCYTYVSTLTYLMEAAEENQIELMILDRPNPYGFWDPSGPYLRQSYESFVGTAPVPFLYSLTLGEYARYMAAARFHKLKLSVVLSTGYRRGDREALFRIPWINPSPNIPSFESAVVYPGVVLFEGTNVSLGRGTTRPFVYSGAPWMNSAAVLEELRKLKLPGVRMAEVTFRPSTSLYTNLTCHGIQIIPVSPEFDPIRTGYEYMRIVKRLHPAWFAIPGGGGRGYFLDRLWGGPDYRRAVVSNMPYEDFRRSWRSNSDHFRKLVRPFLLY